MTERAEKSRAGTRRPRKRTGIRGTRAAVYARVSTQSQVETTSLAVQLRDCRATANRMSLSVVEEFVDAGVSGAKSSRPQLDRLVELIRSGQVDVVLVAKLDRLGRSLLHLLSLLAEWDELGVQVVSINEGFDTSTSVGKLQLSLLGSVAEFERERTRDRIVSGLYARAEQGGFVSSKPPFGYRVVPDPRGRGVVLDVDDEQAATIRRAFELLVVQQVGTSRAIEILNSEGRTAAQGDWTRLGLIAWVRGKAVDTLAGTWNYGGVDVDIPSILTADEAAMMRSWLLATTHNHTSRGPYLLSGLMTTPCGAVYSGRHAVTANKVQSPIYMCANKQKSRRGTPEWCDCGNIRMESADEGVWQQVVDVLTNPVALAGLQAVNSQSTDSLSRITALSQRLSSLESLLVEEYQGPSRLDSLRRPPGRWCRSGRPKWMRSEPIWPERAVLRERRSYRWSCWRPW
ncbi:MAG: recombinase family protein [Nakamurella sp.]